MQYAFEHNEACADVYLLINALHSLLLGWFSNTCLDFRPDVRILMEYPAVTDIPISLLSRLNLSSGTLTQRGIHIACTTRVLGPLHFASLLPALGASAPFSPCCGHQRLNLRWWQVCKQEPWARAGDR